VDFIAWFLLYGFYYMDFIVWILLSGFYCLDFIVWILLSGFHCPDFFVWVFAVFIRILLYYFTNSFELAGLDTIK
jgi:hypothetical protein